jgi:hypothetical protein
VPSMYFIGLDIHKRTISYCVKDVSGRVLSEGTVAATRAQLNEWMKSLPVPWAVAMEATMFTGWIYDYLLPHASAVADSRLPGRPEWSTSGRRPQRQRNEGPSCPFPGITAPLNLSCSVSHPIRKTTPACEPFPATDMRNKPRKTSLTCPLDALVPTSLTEVQGAA